MNPAQRIATSSPRSRAAADDRLQIEQAAEQHLVARSAAVTIVRVPFVVERISVAARRFEELARRGADVEAFDPDRVPLAADDARRDLRAQRLCLLDLGHAEDALVAGGERLGDRRGGPQDVDHDPGRGRRRFVGCERNVNPHAG